MNLHQRVDWCEGVTIGVDVWLDRCVSTVDTGILSVMDVGTLPRHKLVLVVMIELV